MKPIHTFKHCPSCGLPAEKRDCDSFRCPSCEYLYFFNPAIAAGALITNDKGEIVFTRRANNPRKGKLGIPGGFIDVNETAEEAVKREVFEEIGIRLETVQLQYLTNYPNSYTYQGITYPVLDFYYTSSISNPSIQVDTTEVSEIVESLPGDVSMDEIAFPSLRHALGAYIEAYSKSAPSSTFQ
jgi:NAD+ diphosphatase